MSKSSVLNLRGILMTLVAALAIGVSSSSAKAVTAADAIYGNFESQASARWQSMQFNLQLMDQRLRAQLLEGVVNGKSYLQLVKMVDNAAKKGVKEVRSAAKDVHKLAKQARKALVNVGAPAGYISGTYQIDVYVDDYATSINSMLRQYWMQYLNNLLP